MRFAFWKPCFLPSARRLFLSSFMNVILGLCASFTCLVGFVVLYTLCQGSWSFFQHVSPLDFFTNLVWSPETTLPTSSGGKETLGDYGLLPLLSGTAMITILGMVISVPLGFCVAVKTAFFMPKGLRHILKPLMEVFAGLPTIVHGFFALSFLSPFLQEWGESMGWDISGESALGAGMAMGVMMIPMLACFWDDVFKDVPSDYHLHALAMGATPLEAIRTVVIPAAMPGMLSAFFLTLSRAIGETMLVLMATSIGAYLTLNPFASVTTITVQMITMLTGDQAFDSPKTLSAFALALCLFIMTLVLNALGSWIQHRYERYRTGES